MLDPNTETLAQPCSLLLDSEYPEIKNNKDIPQQRRNRENVVQVYNGIAKFMSKWMLPEK